MRSFFVTPRHVDRTQGRLLSLAALFLFLYSIALTLAPAVRMRSWEVDLNWAHWAGLGIWLVSLGVAHWFSSRYLPERDPFILPLAGLLMGWGLMTIWRLTPAFGLRQSLWLLMGTVAMVVTLRLSRDLRYIRDFKYLWLTGGLLLTGLTLVLGTNPSGAGPRLWLGCCGFYIQPSEPLKLLLIGYLAAYLADRQFLIPNLLPLLAPTLVMTGLTVLLLVVQRDLGTASIFLILYTAVTFFATGKKRVLILSGVILLVAGALGYFLFDVVRLRIEAWINPWLDPSGRSYQIVQSLMAVAAGGLFGRGPGLGSPTVVPVHHSDFIFAAIAEETGLVGVIGIIAVVALLTARHFRAALSAPDSFRRYLAIGLLTYLAAQTTLIIGGNLRFLPLTGVTMPFVSYGGSSLITSFFALTLLLIISQRGEVSAAPLAATHPTRVLAGGLFLGLAGVAIISGWWAIYRNPTLLDRTDNPRRVIGDRFVPRGSLLDREEIPLNFSDGIPGEYERFYQLPAMGPVLGYIHPVYGQAGLEDTMDPYLRGIEGQDPYVLLWNNILYGQPPPGLDVRLTIDSELQSQGDSLLENLSGAFVLLNAQTGEILAMGSHPTYDSNRLDDIWPTLIQATDAPLLNRATLGRYHAGSVMGPLLLGAISSEDLSDEYPDRNSLSIDNLELTCVETPTDITWSSLVANGCPGAVAALATTLGYQKTSQLFQDMDWETQPALRIALGDNVSLPTTTDPSTLVLSEEFRVSPLQIALMAASITSDGIVPAPRLAVAFRNPTGEWEFLPALGDPHQVLSETAAGATSSQLAVPDSPIWMSLSISPVGGESGVTWFIGGTSVDWQGAPLALALVIEDKAPALAQEIGLNLLNTALAP